MVVQRPSGADRRLQGPLCIEHTRAVAYARPHEFAPVESSRADARSCANWRRACPQHLWASMAYRRAPELLRTTTETVVPRPAPGARVPTLVSAHEPGQSCHDGRAQDPSADHKSGRDGLG
jgi:hypothetical protein